MNLAFIHHLVVLMLVASQQKEKVLEAAQEVAKEVLEVQLGMGLGGSFCSSDAAPDHNVITPKICTLIRKNYLKPQLRK